MSYIAIAEKKIVFFITMRKELWLSTNSKFVTIRKDRINTFLVTHLSITYIKIPFEISRQFILMLIEIFISIQINFEVAVIKKNCGQSGDI